MMRLFDNVYALHETRLSNTEPIDSIRRLALRLVLRSVVNNATNEDDSAWHAESERELE